MTPDEGSNRWLRGGSCCRCGDCCQGDPGILDLVTGERLPAAVIDGVEYCPHFTQGASDERAICGIHDESDPRSYYNSGCNVWPSVPAHVAAYPRCTYTFAPA